MSSEYGPFQEEVNENTCAKCPIRSLSEEQLVKLCVSQDDYGYLGPRIKQMRRIAKGLDKSGPTGVRAAFEELHNEISFEPVDSTLDEAYGELEEKDRKLIYVPNVDIYGEDTAIPETEFPYEDRVVLQCLRNITAHRCAKVANENWDIRASL